MQARHFLRPGEQLRILVPRGRFLAINWADQTGQSDNWVINTQRHIDRVVIYHRDETTEQNGLGHSTCIYGKQFRPTSSKHLYAVRRHGALVMISRRSSF
jgi:hypothetical protein